MLVKFEQALTWTSLVGLGALIGCQSVSTAMHREIVSSLPFDNIPCEELVALRNQESARFDLPRNAQVDHSDMLKISSRLPLESLAPDLRSRAAREEGLARGRIAAMNRSLKRRNCEGDA